ncbi:TIGR04222 domain-containing membrane protein [Nocardia aurantiaca]|uniref:TIGR04222 domain-containing membrane protein n=1 Tax=Nocardia aurantiaca TaxID=2675850 RepID=A0A6I3L4A9_9NOCA|nr:TIGR04222 domain-containing membrane protein [Nocardia aurantiaca]MTE14719.1 TIGR04222 domain-containing membrane protein [Nocardia aurantiaca]
MVLRTDAAAAATDTWGISGPAFLQFYAIAALVAVIFGFARRTSVLRTIDPAWLPAGPLRPSETAMLVDDKRPVLAGLAQLRGHQIIDSTATPVRTPSDTEQRNLDPISGTLYAHLLGSPRRRIPDMVAATGSAVSNLREKLTGEGYLLGEKQRKALWTARIPLLGLLLLGLVRVFAGLSAHHPVGFLIVAMIVLAVLSWAVGRPSRLTRRGRDALAAAHAGNRHLRPANSPAYAAYGPDSAALAVALFGGLVLWTLDPALAGAANVVAGGGGSDSSSCGSGSSCGSSDSGSSCSSSSSCGSSCGGGCGGGCGG